jgi:high-affinity iron transporter
MYSSALIVFREVLEAALVVTIVLAAARGVKGRGAVVAIGLTAGLLGALGVAFLADTIAGLFEGMGQEVFNATVLLLAVLMLGWHNIWMSSHAKSNKLGFENIGASVREGSKPPYVLSVAVALAVLREGSEIVLFLHGVAASGQGSAGMLTGGVVGLLLGALFGAMLYLGLLRIPARHIFKVMSWMILLLAAGMASQAVGFLMQAGYLPDQQPLWNTSGLLPVHSIFGQLMHILVGYDARPTALQLAMYVATIAVIILGMKTAGATRPQPAKV